MQRQPRGASCRGARVQLHQLHAVCMHHLSYTDANAPKEKELWFHIPALVASSLWHIVSLCHVYLHSTKILSWLLNNWSLTWLKAAVKITAHSWHSWWDLGWAGALSHCLWLPGPCPLLTTQGGAPSISSKDAGCQPAWCFSEHLHQALYHLGSLRSPACLGGACPEMPGELLRKWQTLATNIGCVLAVNLAVCNCKRLLWSKAEFSGLFILWGLFLFGHAGDHW